MRRELRGKRLERVFLGEWEEYVGWLTGVEEGPEGLEAAFDRAAVVLPRDVENIQNFVGRKVGILRTDDVKRPICIRTMPK